MSDNIGVKTTIDKVDGLVGRLEALTKNRVLVGIPATNAGRKDTPVTNADIGYINEFGSPAQNIPPRPFLIPGVRGARERLAKQLKAAAVQALTGDRESVIKRLHAIGMIAQNAVRKKITDGPFVPLADATVAARAKRGRKGAIEEMQRRAAGQAPGTDLAKPLLDTGTLRRSITYVLRGKWI
jgi:hypothetical protein